MVVHDWTREPWPDSRGKSGGQPPKRVDWTFTVWTPENFYQLFGGAEGNHFSSHPNFRQPVPAPRIDLYVGKDHPIIWEDVEVPATVRVVDRRATKATVDGAVGGVVRGGVFDMATHQVIASADVVLSQRTDSRQWQEAARVKTNEAGSFEIQDLPAGYYSLEVHAEGYADRHVATYHNRSGHEDLDLDVLLVRAVACQGTVIDTDGNPIAGVTVLARDMVGLDGFGYECPIGPQAKTDEAGRFELLSLPGGTTHLRCRAPSLHQETPISETYEVSDKPRRQPQPITIVMSGTGTVTGKVVGPDGQPPTRKFIAEIEPKGGNTAGSWGGSMQCQEDGTFSFKGVPPGEYLVTAKPNPMRSGEASEPQLVIVRTGGTLELEFVNDYAHAKKGR